MFMQSYYYFYYLKTVGTARLGEGDLLPISPKTTELQYQHMEIKKKNGKQ